MASSEKKLPLDLSHHFSYVTRARQASSIKSFYKYFSIPGIANLAGGLPNAQYFPFDTLEGAVATPDRWKPRTTDKDGASTSEHVIVPHDSDTKDVFLKIDLASALQYGTAQGYPPLWMWLKEFATQTLHPNIPYKDGANIILTVGSTDGFSKTLLTLSNEWHEGIPISEKQGLLMEEFAYMAPVGQSRPRGLNIVPVGMDNEGMIPEKLESTLDNWDTKRGKRPHLLYTVSIGQNPTGGTTSIVRRKALYAICQKYDVIIIEDDPYWYLQYDLEGKSVDPSDTSSFKSSGYPFIDSLTPSYLNFDPDGRVIRLDTFSKTVAPGCRLGWITAQPAIIERIERLTEGSTQQPSGFVQSLISELILGPNGWRTPGFVRWLEGLRGEYERRVLKMCEILDAGRSTVRGSRSEDGWEIVKTTPMYSFERPKGGMFLWIRLHLENHQVWGKYPPQLIAQACWVHLTKKKFLVLVAPGLIFCPTPEVGEANGWKFVRVCFAAVNDERIESASHGFVDGIKSFWKVKEIDDIENLTRIYNEITASD